MAQHASPKRAAGKGRRPLALARPRKRDGSRVSVGAEDSGCQRARWGWDCVVHQSQRRAPLRQT